MDVQISKRNTESRGNPIALLAAILLWLVLVSTWFMSGLSARFVSAGEAGDEARVAKFAVSESGTYSQTLDVSICPDESETPEQIAVTNTSEVTLNCKITIKKLTNNVPTKIVNVKDQDTSYTETETNTYTIEKTLNPSDTATLSCEIVWGNDHDAKYAGMVDCCTVTVTAAQVD